MAVMPFYIISRF